MSLMRGVSLLTALLVPLSGVGPDVAAQAPEGHSGVVVDAAALENALPEMSAAGRARLLQAVGEKNFSGRIGTKDAKEVAAVNRIGVEELMHQLLPLAKLYSSPPLTGYRVGVVAKGKSGALYLGANLEVPGTTLGASVHGEQSAIANASA